MKSKPKVVVASGKEPLKYISIACQPKPITTHAFFSQKQAKQYGAQIAKQPNNNYVLTTHWYHDLKSNIAKSLKLSCPDIVYVGDVIYDWNSLIKTYDLITDPNVQIAKKSHKKN